MAAHNPGPLEKELDEYEQVPEIKLFCGKDADGCSYESLPPNFSLTANMVAGAFAGIAVCPPSRQWDIKSAD
jgi:hypothetical protein